MARLTAMQRPSNHWHLVVTRNVHKTPTESVPKTPCLQVQIHGNHTASKDPCKTHDELVTCTLSSVPVYEHSNDCHDTTFFQRSLWNENHSREHSNVLRLDH